MYTNGLIEQSLVILLKTDNLNQLEYILVMKTHFWAYVYVLLRVVCGRIYVNLARHESAFYEFVRTYMYASLKQTR